MSDDELSRNKNLQCSVECALPVSQSFLSGFEVDTTSACQSWSQISNSICSSGPQVYRTSGNCMLSELIPISVLDSIAADPHIQISAAQYGRWIIFP